MRALRSGGTDSRHVRHVRHERCEIVNDDCCTLPFVIFCACCLHLLAGKSKEPRLAFGLLCGEQTTVPTRQDRFPAAGCVRSK